MVLILKGVSGRLLVYYVAYLPMQNVYLPTQMIFCYITHCVSVCKFLKDIFGGQTGDKKSHRKIKKNNKTLSENDTEM